MPLNRVGSKIFTPLTTSLLHWCLFLSCISIFMLTAAVNLLSVSLDCSPGPAAHSSRLLLVPIPIQIFLLINQCLYSYTHKLWNGLVSVFPKEFPEKEWSFREISQDSFGTLLFNSTLWSFKSHPLMDFIIWSLLCHLVKNCPFCPFLLPLSLIYILSHTFSKSTVLVEILRDIKFIDI